MSGLLAAAPAAAPAVPAAAITGALILAAFAWVVLYGSMQGYDYSLGALMRKFADMVEDIWIVGGTLADALRGLDTYVLRQMGKGLDGLEEGMARLFDGLAWVVTETANALVDFGSDVYYAIEGIVAGEIPTQIGNVARPLRDDLAGLRKRVRQIVEAELARLGRGIDRLDRGLTREALRAERGIDALNERITSVVMPGLRVLDRRLDSVIGYTRRTLARRLSTVEKLVLSGALAAAATAALTRAFPYWQCTNVRGFNRALCRMGVGDLNGLLGLLAGTALLALALDPRVLAKAAETVTGGLEGIIRETAIR